MLLEILASPLLGGITGFISSWMKQKQELEILKENNSHSKAMAQLNSENSIRETEAKTEAYEKKMEGKAFVSAQDSWKSSLMSSVRIVISFYLLGWMTYLAFEINALIGGLSVLEIADVIDLYKHIIFGILYLTITCVTFWFGQRPSHAFRMINEKV